VRLFALLPPYQVNEDNTLKLCDMGLACYVPHAATLPGEAHHTQHTQTLDPHVQTRWYRAPEVILLDPHYGTASDIWSCGAVLGDLFEMQLRPRGQRRPLFPGRFCFPLSPAAQPPHPPSKPDTDQLRVVLDVLGPPSFEDLASVRNPVGRSIVQYAVQQQQRQATLPVVASPASSRPFATWSLAQRFAGVDPQALDLMHHMLQFQPQRRWTASQCLAHPYFASVRRECHRETTYAHVAHDPLAAEAGATCFCFQCTESRTLSFAETKAALTHHVRNDNPQLLIERES
jgi:mitogen-activated protein kinase 1/3